MSTRLTSWRLVLLPVGFMLGCVLLASLTWRSFGGTTPLEAKGYRVHIPLPEAPNLFPGADARIAGVTVGEVIAVRRDGRGAVATVELEPRHVPLRTGATAALRSKTLLGEGFLALAPGPVNAAPIPENGRLAARQVRRTQRLDDVLSAFDPRTRAQLRALTKDFARAWGDQGPAVNATLGNAAPLTGAMDTVLATLDRQSGDVGDLISSSGTVLQALGERAGTLQAVVVNGERLFEITARQERGLRATVRELPAFLRETRGTARSLRRAAPELGAASRALREATPHLAPTLRQIDRSAPDLRRLLRDLPPTLAEAQRGLPGLRRIVDATGPAFDKLHPVLREAIPVLDLFGIVSGSLVTTLAGVGQIHNGTQVGPGGRVLRYASGVITLWNESIGGWVKRLPSNRGNTYPKPGFLDDIGKGLASYDCRHTGNRPYLAPFGGAPECRTQGQWTFRGETRAYPHLTPTAP